MTSFGRFVPTEFLTISLFQHYLDWLSCIWKVSKPPFILFCILIICFWMEGRVTVKVCRISQCRVDQDVKIISPPGPTCNKMEQKELPQKVTERQCWEIFLRKWVPQILSLCILWCYFHFPEGVRMSQQGDGKHLYIFLSLMDIRGGVVFYCWFKLVFVSCWCEFHFPGEFPLSQQSESEPPVPSPLT